MRVFSGYGTIPGQDERSICGHTRLSSGRQLVLGILDCDFVGYSRC